MEVLSLTEAETQALLRGESVPGVAPLADDALPPPFIFEHALRQARLRPALAGLFLPKLWCVDGQVVGSALFKALNEGALEVGYGVARAAQGRGFATEGLKALLPIAFSCPEVARVVAEVSPENHASRRVVEKAGFSPFGARVDPEDGPLLCLEHRGDYCAYYCEENIWRLCQRPGFNAPGCYAVLITGDAGGCLLAHQRAGGAEGLVVWDYHVIYLRRGPAGDEIWDLDTTLPYPCEASAYLTATFPPHPRLEAKLRPIPAATYVATLSSDRTHMKGPDGRFVAPPPPWAPPTAGPANLHALLTRTTPVVRPEALLDRF